MSTATRRGLFGFFAAAAALPMLPKAAIARSASAALEPLAFTTPLRAFPLSYLWTIGDRVLSTSPTLDPTLDLAVLDLSEDAVVTCTITDGLGNTTQTEVGISAA